MRRILSLSLTVLTVLSAISFGALSTAAKSITTGTEYGADASSASTTYLPKQPPEGTAATQITTAEEFAAMNGSDGVFVLANDITVSSSVSSFKGQLYGNGKTVTTSAPLFVTIDGASLKKGETVDVGASVYDLTIAGEITNKGCGALASEVKDATIYHVVNNAKITKNNETVGGLVGSVNGESATLFACLNHGAVSGKSSGGLVGSITGLNVTLKNCINNGTVTCTQNGDGYAGGIVGITDTSETTVTLESCINTGTVTGGISVGGIAGTAKDCKSVSVTSCQNAGAVSSATYSGGIMGLAENCSTLVFKHCTNKADVTASTYAGGIIPFSSSSISIDSCTNSGDVLSKLAGGYAAGIIAMQSYDATESVCNSKDRFFFQNCANLGAVNAAGYAAGILAFSRNVSTTQSCINLGAVAGGTGAAGIVGISWSKGGGINGGYGTNVNFCINNAPVVSDAAAAGILLSATNANGNYIFGCLSLGDATSTTSTANAIASYIWGNSTMRFNTATGKITAARNSAATPMLNYNTGGSRFNHNIFLQNKGDISGAVTLLLCDRNAASIYTADGAIHDNYHHNYIREGVVKYHHLLRPNYQPMPEDYAFYFTDSDLETDASVKAKFGEEFVLNDGIPMYKDVVALYELSKKLSLSPDAIAPPSPTEIKTEAEFLEMGICGSYKLSSDITLRSSYLLPFYGSLDGGGHTVTLVGAPMFREIEDATVTNLKLENTVKNESLPFIGAVTPTAHRVTLENISSTASVIGANGVGGLVGSVDGMGIFKNCSVYATVTSSSGNAAGLVCSSEKAEELIFEGCTYNGTVTARYHGGGLIAYARSVSDLSVKSCNIFPGITASQSVGGILGYVIKSKSVTVTDCTVSGFFKAEDSGVLGGVIGRADSSDSVTLDSCAVSGNFTATGNLGGIIAENAEIPNGGTFHVTSCIYSGIQPSAAGGDVGGIVGSVMPVGKDLDFKIEGCAVVSDLLAEGQVAGIAQELNGINGSRIVYNVSGNLILGSIHSDNASAKDSGGLVGYAHNENPCLELCDNAVYLDINLKNNLSPIGAFGGCGNPKNGYVKNNLFVGSVSVLGKAVLAITRNSGEIPTSAVAGNHYFLTGGKSFDGLFCIGNEAPTPIGSETVQMTSATQDTSATLGDGWTFVTDHRLIVTTFTGMIPASAKTTLELAGLMEPLPDVSETTESKNPDTSEPSDNITTKPEDGVTAPDISTADTSAVESSGCGSVVSTSLALAVAVLIPPVLIAFRKKDEQL